MVEVCQRRVEAGITGEGAGEVLLGGGGLVQRCEGGAAVGEGARVIWVVGEGNAEFAEGVGGSGEFEIDAAALGGDSGLVWKAL